MIPKDLKFLIALNHFPKFGPARIKRLQKYFTRLEAAFNASAAELKMAGIEETLAHEFAAARAGIIPDRIMENLERENINIVVLDDPDYPKLLKEIFYPPPFLYYKGILNRNDDFCLAVVGTRKLSGYGKQVTETIVRELAQNSMIIVSGLAYGIDTLAHRTSLEAGGRTIAVLGTGLDKRSIYPSSNRYLADKITGGGGVIFSEFAPGTPPLRQNFPQRNRIISGLSLGTLVVEAAEKSGALITARYALEQNREVFAVPGNIFSATSIGPNNLINQGAKPVTGGKDIMEALDLIRITSYIENKKIMPASPAEELIISHLGAEPLHIDELARLTKLDTPLLNSALTMMEMKGMVKNLGGMQYVIAR
jgi:DNA processing protein